jgi:hypothetical protein
MWGWRRARCVFPGIEHLRRKVPALMYSDCVLKAHAFHRQSRGNSGPGVKIACAIGPAVLLFAFFASSGTARASEPEQIHWGAVTEAQVQVDQTTPLTWGIYQPQKKGKPEKKRSNLVLALIGHRYLLIDIKSKKVYEVPRKEVHVQGDDVDTGDLLSSSRLLPTSDWIWRDVGPADLYRVRLGDYGLVLQLTLPHLYLISPYY